MSDVVILKFLVVIEIFSIEYYGRQISGPTCWNLRFYAYYSVRTFYIQSCRKPYAWIPDKYLHGEKRKQPTETNKRLIVTSNKSN